MLAAADPANPYGAALPWPTSGGEGARPGRKAGALVVLVDGELAWFLERGGRSLLTFTDDPGAHDAAAAALANLVTSRRVAGCWWSASTGCRPWPPRRGVRLLGALEAGFHTTPRGLRLR